METCAMGKHKTKRLPRRQSWAGGEGVFGLLMFLNPIPFVSLTTQQMDFYYRLYLRPPPPKTRQKATFHFPVQSQYPQPTLHKNVLLSCTITISPTHPLQKTFHCPVQSHYLYPPCHKTTLCRPPTVALPNLVTAYCSLQLRFIATIEPSVVWFESLSTAFLKLFSSGDHFH